MIKELNLKFKIKENPRGIKKRQLSYSIVFKIEVVNYTEKTWKPGSLKAFWLISDREDDTRMEEAKERFNQSRKE